MICFSRNDIEKIAQRVLRSYYNLPCLKGISITRIEPDLLAREVLKLTLDFVHLSLDGETLGVTSYEETGVEVYDEDDTQYICCLDGKTILVERDLYLDVRCLGRCNFSIAHESAHQIFGQLYPHEYGAPAQNPSIHFYRTIKQERNHRITDWAEWQANALASALLMPKKMLLADMKMFDLGEKISILNSIYYQEVFYKFRLLAEYLGVSQQALMIRMKHLGLIDKEYLNRARTMLDITMEDPK